MTDTITTGTITIKHSKSLLGQFLKHINLNGLANSYSSVQVKLKLDGNSCKFNLVWDDELNCETIAYIPSCYTGRNAKCPSHIYKISTDELHISSHNPYTGIYGKGLPFIQRNYRLIPSFINCAFMHIESPTLVKRTFEIGLVSNNDDTFIYKLIYDSEKFTIDELKYILTRILFNYDDPNPNYFIRKNKKVMPLPLIAALS